MVGPRVTARRDKSLLLGGGSWASATVTKGVRAWPVCGYANKIIVPVAAKNWRREAQGGEIFTKILHAFIYVIRNICCTHRAISATPKLVLMHDGLYCRK
jgi:hypothetical protein